MTTTIINTHINDRHIAGDEDVTPDGDWIRLSAGITASLEAISGRDYVLGHIAPHAGGGAPACYYHPTETVYIDGSTFAKEADKTVMPGEIDVLRFTDRDRIPVTWGLVTHEAGHARATRWTARLREDEARLRFDPRWIDAAMLLEEPRMEYRQLQARPQDLKWLRASAMTLIVGEGGAETSRGALAKAMILVGGRVEGGILDKSEVADIMARFPRAFTFWKLIKMRAIVQKVLTVGDDDAEAMIDLGRQWCQLLGDDAGTGGESGSLDGKLPHMPGAGIPLPPGLQRAMRSVAKKISDPSTPLDDREVQRQMNAAAAKEAERLADEVFGGEEGGWGKGGGQVKGYRKPAAKEEGAASRLAQELWRLMPPERAATRVTNARPPGRLRMSAAVSGRAQRAARQVSTAEPFRSVQRKSNPRPPLRFGLVQDVSNSQAKWAAQAAVAGWTVARAVSHMPNAESAMVVFDDMVVPVLWPNREPPGVPELGTPGGTTKGADAIKALDGKLGLTRRGYARLLVLVTDGQYTGGTGFAVVAEVKRLLAAGCKVIWLRSGRSGGGQPLPKDVLTIDVTQEPGEIANIICDAVIRMMGTSR